MKKKASTILNDLMGSPPNQNALVAPNMPGIMTKSLSSMSHITLTVRVYLYFVQEETNAELALLA